MPPTRIWQVEGQALNAEGDMVVGSLGELVLSGLYFRQFWWGSVAVPDTTNAIDSNVDAPCRVTSGNDAYGTAVPICGTGDDPCPTLAQTSFNLDRVLPITSSVITVWKLRISWGSGTQGDAITAGQYSEVMVIPNLVVGLPSGNAFPITTARIPAGYKVWAEGWNVTNGATMDFFWSCHGHPAA
jgi:hypothetical protein